MFGRLLLLSFFALPLIEIAVFIMVGQAIGVLPTLLGVVLMGIIGVMVIRTRGLSLLGQLQSGVSRGELPGRQIADAMLVALGGALLVLPGYFSDVVGLLLLIPPVRGFIYGQLAKRMKVVSTTSYTTSEPGLIELDDGEWRER